MEHERALLEQLITQGAAPEIILEQSQKLDRLIVDSYLERSIEGLKMS